MRAAAQLIASKTSVCPDIGVVLGSGLGAFASSLDERISIPYKELPGMPQSTAVGHLGELVIGRLGGTGEDAIGVAAMSGRFHLYEGYTAREVARGMALFRELGIRRAVITNAAGAINPSYSPGALVLISDHINLLGANPLTGPNDTSFGPRFPDMTEAYAAWMRAVAHETGAQLGLSLPEGVYAAVPGPSYETPAEIRFLRIIGADLVGMSTVPEVIAANHMGMDVLAISCVTNAAAGLGGEKLKHEDVLEIGARASQSLTALLTALLPKLCQRSAHPSRSRS